MYRYFSLCLVVLCLASCTHVKPIPTRTMDFEEGVRALAGNLADQLENSSVGNVLNKIVINPLTKQKQLKKIVIDPFIDVESGYPVKANSRINELISAQIQKRFQVSGEMEPDKLEVAEYILNGMATLEEKLGEQGSVYRIKATVFEKSSGKVLASAVVHISRFDTTPMDIYKDSPVYLKGKSYEQYLTSLSKSPNQTVNKEYIDRLAIKSILVKGDILYEQKEFKKSLAYYNQAAGSQTVQRLEVLNGQYTNLARQEQWAEAEEVFGKLAKTSVSETSGITSKITFGPNSKQPVESKIVQYNIFMKQIASLVATVPECKIEIIGHCSRSGTGGYNDKLSLQRAQWIQKKMASYASEVMNKSKTIGRGFRENIVGTGKDDLTDEIDRRVEFKFSQCSTE